MKKFKNIIIAVVLLGIIGAGIAYWQYNKPHRNATSEKAGYTLTATELFDAFDTDEQAAMAKYGNQLVEVSGTLREKVERSDTKAMLILETDNPIFGIKCMFEGSIEKEITPGQSVVVRGFCSGINGDVEMTRCAIKSK